MTVMTICEKDGCDKLTKRKSLCESHYFQMYRKSEKEFDVNGFWLFIKKELNLE